ncbi:MAG TPA: hypothetical protein VFU21_31075 [Kofleriaceae bacterium]|nr:hypothetical protein [Kofleriaceae bacterium]
MKTYLTLSLLIAGGCVAADIGEGEDPGLEEIELAADNGIFLDNGLNLPNGMNLGNGTALSNGMNLGNGIDLANGMNLGNGLNLGNGITGPYYAPPAGSGLEQWIDVDPAMRARILRYLIECALPAGVEVQLAYRGRLETLGRGVAGLGPRLQAGRMSVTEAERVTACMLARMNGTGRTIQIDMFGPMGPAFETTVPADDAFPVLEAAFFGNLFSAEPVAQACQAAASPLEEMRSCRDRGGVADCGILEFTTDVCWDYLTAQCDVFFTTGTSQRAYYSNCYGGEASWQHVITTYLAPP